MLERRPRTEPLEESEDVALTAERRESTDRADCGSGELSEAELKYMAAVYEMQRLAQKEER